MPFNSSRLVIRNANLIRFDNTGTNLVAEQVQDALTELDSDLTAIIDRDVLLEADTDYFLDPDTGDDNNDGLTPGTAWATVEKAISIVARTNLNGFTLRFIFIGTITAPTICCLYNYSEGTIIWQEGGAGGNLNTPLIVICPSASFEMRGRHQGLSFINTRDAYVTSFSGNTATAFQHPLLFFRNTKAVVEDASFDIRGQYTSGLFRATQGSQVEFIGTLQYDSDAFMTPTVVLGDNQGLYQADASSHIVFNLDSITVTANVVFQTFDIGVSSHKAIEGSTIKDVGTVTVDSVDIFDTANFDANSYVQVGSTIYNGIEVVTAVPTANRVPGHIQLNTTNGNLYAFDTASTYYTYSPSAGPTSV